MNKFISKVNFFINTYQSIRLELALRNLLTHNLDWCHAIKPVRLELYPTYAKYHLYENKNIDLCKIEWYSNGCSPIHGHPERGCILKVLDGVLIENNYEKTSKQPTFLNTRIIQKNNIGVQYGYTNLHQIQTTNKATSLHLYLLD
jgi:hypothetical protein